MRRDIILITIDCWRHDAPENMPRLKKATEEFFEGTAICHAPATDGSFPAILSSGYYPEVYDSEGKIRSDIEPLPKILRENEYATGAFIGANPFLNKWQKYFDEFFNGDFTHSNQDSFVWRAIDFAKRTLTLSQKYPAEIVRNKAKAWYNSQSSPCFLWMHFMDPHGPLHPGLGNGIDIGLFSSWVSLLEYRFTDNRFNGDLSTIAKETIPKLYRACLREFDIKFESILEFVSDDATVIITGDHGEEFDHGVYAHARLYDECVKVPLFVKWTLSDYQFELDEARHLDLAPSVLNAIDIEQPDNWQGIPAAKNGRPAHILNHIPQTDIAMSAIRTTEDKLIRTYDTEVGECISTEYFDLIENPEEKRDHSSRSPPTELDRNLTKFEQKISFYDTIGRKTVVDDDIKTRLKELGYKQ